MKAVITIEDVESESVSVRLEFDDGGGDPNAPSMAAFLASEVLEHIKNLIERDAIRPSAAEPGEVRR